MCRALDIDLPGGMDLDVAARQANVRTAGRQQVAR